VLPNIHSVLLPKKSKAGSKGASGNVSQVRWMYHRPPGRYFRASSTVQPPCASVPRASEPAYV
jgi:hypothetical protein